MKRFVFISLSALLAATNLHTAENVLSVDFSDEDPDAPPLSALTEGLSGQVTVVDGKSLPPDPFKPDENKSLKLEKVFPHDPIPRATWQFPNCSAGTLSFRAYLIQNESFSDPMLNIFLMEETVEKIGPDIYFTKDEVAVRDGDDSRRYPNIWNAETSIDVQITFYPDKTYSLEIGGEPFPEKDTRFSFRYKDLQELNAVQFAIADGVRSEAMVFVDDISMQTP